MSLHDIKETTRISPATTADQTTNPLMKEFLETAVAAFKNASLRDQAALGDFRKDGTMLLGLAPLTDFIDSAMTSEQLHKQGRRASEDSTSSRRTGELTQNLSGDASTNRSIGAAPRNGDALPSRSKHEQIVNTISAAKDALRSRSHESNATSVVMQGSISAIAKSILSDLPRSSQSEGSVVSGIRAIIQETANKNVAPPPRPK